MLIKVLRPAVFESAEGRAESSPQFCSNLSRRGRPEDTHATFTTNQYKSVFSYNVHVLCADTEEFRGSQ